MDRRASEVECAFYVSWPSICVNVTVLRASRTCFNDGTSGPYIEPRDDQRDVGEIENLGTVWQTKSPKLGGRPKYVYESFPVARADLRAPRKADEVGNLVFRYASNNYNGAMARNAKLTIVEAEEIVYVLPRIGASFPMLITMKQSRWQPLSQRDPRARSVR